MKRRLISLFMTTVMLLACMPTAAIAAPAEGEEPTQQQVEPNNEVVVQDVDKTALNAAISEKGSIYGADKESQEWLDFVVALADARQVSKDDGTTQKQVDQAMTTLNETYEALVPQSVHALKLVLTGLASQSDPVEDDLIVAGSSPITVEVQYQQSVATDAWKTLPFSEVTLTADTGAEIQGNQVRWTGVPDKTFTIKVEACGTSASAEVQSQWVKAESAALPSYTETAYIHERTPDGNFKPMDVGAPVVQPTNVSQPSAWKTWNLTSSNSSVARVEGHLLYPQKSGSLTLNFTVSRDVLDGIFKPQVKGSSNMVIFYWNPVAEVSAEETALTVTRGQSVALPLTFTGVKTDFPVTEPSMDWVFSSENGGEVTLKQGDLDQNGVASSDYTLTGVTPGTVTVTGTAKDTTNLLEPVTFTVTVEPETVLQKDYPKIAQGRIDEVSQQLQNPEKGFGFGSEWEIFSLVRSGHTPEQAQIDAYLDSVEMEFQSQTVHTPTQEAAVILALGVLDQNAANFRGIDLIDRLTGNPAISGSVADASLALIALDSLHYFVTENTIWDRDSLISVLLNAQKPDGSFGTVYETALAVQALAPYVQRATFTVDATTPVDQAMDFLKAHKEEIFASSADATQMLMTLSALGLDPVDPANGFVGEDGKTLIDVLETALSNPNMSDADRGLVVCALNSYVRADAGDNKVSDLTDTSKPAAYWQLQDRVDLSAGLNQKDYTADSWIALEQARKEAEQLLKKPGVTEEELNQAHAALKDAMIGLKQPAPSDGHSEPAKPDSKTTTVEVEAKLDKDGVAVAEMSDAVAKKFAKDLAAGKDEAGSQAIVKVKIPQGAKGISMTLPGTAMEALSKTSQTSLAIHSEAGSAELSPQALSTAAEASGSGKLTMAIKQTGEEAQKTASQAVQDSIGERPVYDVTLTADEQPVSQLGGDASIFVPYVPAEGENIAGLTVLYLNEEGEAVELTDARYDAEAGGMVFDTTHFSIYAVALRDGGNMPFTDVKSSDWFYDEVGFVYSNRIMNGTSATKFTPQGETTRGMIVSILWRLEGKPAVSSRLKYQDVPLGTYYTEAVRWASHMGIINGFTPTEFAPNAAISRQQLAAILYRYAGFKGYDTRAYGTLSIFKDAAVVSEYSRVPLTWAISKGLMQGRADGTLAPQGTATRAHVAAILTRFTERVAK